MSNNSNNNLNLNGLKPYNFEEFVDELSKNSIKGEAGKATKESMKMPKGFKAIVTIAILTASISFIIGLGRTMNIPEKIEKQITRAKDDPYVIALANEIIDRYGYDNWHDNKKATEQEQKNDNKKEENKQVKPKKDYTLYICIGAGIIVSITAIVIVILINQKKKSDIEL